MDFYALDLFIFNLSLLPIVFFSMLYYIMTLSNFRIKFPRLRFKKPKRWPFVTIQIPVYNDPVAVRCIESCLKLDYPKNKLQIIVADDSTDPKTIKLLSRYKDKVQIIRRKNRKGFKAGALNNALKYTKGEIIVLFDSDWIPPRNFLKKIVTPFLKDEKVAAVQTNIDYLNHNVNIITRFAAYLLMSYYNVWIPWSNKWGVVFFGGTSGAIRKKALMEAGGWNEDSLTEDADLSVKLLSKGYKIVYLYNVKSKGELPYTLESFLKQQMRWAYGQVRVFVENWKDVLSNKLLSFKQKLMIFLTNLGSIVAPFVLLMTITGQLGWVLGEPKPIQMVDIVKFFSTFLATGGFFAIGALGLYRSGRSKEIVYFFPAGLALGILLSFATSIAFIRAITGRKMVWFRTPKWGSIKILDIFRKLFRSFSS